MASDFEQVLAASPARGSAFLHTATTVSVASGRLSYTLGLHGPCVSYDTACSAVLVACHGALRALQLNECVDGLVAGVRSQLCQPRALTSPESCQLAVLRLREDGLRFHALSASQHDA